MKAMHSFCSSIILPYTLIKVYAFCILIFQGELSPCTLIWVLHFYFWGQIFPPCTFIWACTLNFLVLISPPAWLFGTTRLLGTPEYSPFQFRTLYVKPTLLENDLFHQLRPHGDYCSGRQTIRIRGNLNRSSIYSVVLNTVMCTYSAK